MSAGDGRAFVLDASAVLAVLLDEEGLDRVLPAVPTAAICAEAAARLRPATRHAGLSLADRACLALARRLGVPAVTADRAWGDLDVGVEVRLIR